MLKIKLLKSLVPILLLVIVSYISYRFYLKDIYWNNQTQTIHIDERFDSKVYELKKHKKQEEPYSLEIEITGTSKENISFMVGSSPTNMTKKISIKKGEINFETVSDWYQETCFILVQSEGNKRFDLDVNYRFITSAN